jgi:plastocyanin
MGISDWMKRVFVVLAALLVVVGGVGCSKDEASDVAGDTADAVESAAADAADAAGDAADRAEDVVNDRNVEIDDFYFEPKTRTVKVGTEVTWVSDGDAAHTVTSDTDAFDSDQIESDEEFSFRFTQKGTYAYHCENHPDQMKGKVVVES